MPRKGDRKDLTGQGFGGFRVLGFSHQDKGYRSHWRCVCECGRETVVEGHHLTGGRTVSCGCRSKSVPLTHGATTGGKWSPEYRSWAAMLARVRATSGVRLKNYSGRGITVCERWLAFENFLADMGPRPAGTSIDRIKNDGSYEPGNCRWATPKEQRSNQRPRLARVTNDEPKEQIA